MYDSYIMCLRYVTIAPARARDETFGVVMHVQEVFFQAWGNCTLLLRVSLGGAATLIGKAWGCGRGCGLYNVC
jgi:hypothetical protein